jgi:NADH:ubiquinone oxidoreductase subunit 5 (subunit L)/multisubunit Na+/H+ antiporter MnhA subunit
MDALVILIPFLPLLAAIVIGGGQLFGWLRGEASEQATADIAVWSAVFTAIQALTLLGADLLGKNQGSFSIGQWLSSDLLNVRVNFITTGFNVQLAALFSLLLLVSIRFSVNYMHREAGFHRFFFILSLFSSGMYLLVLSGNAMGTFAGWEIAGLCSYLLIGYAYHRPVAASNAVRVFVTNRIGDAAFILGIALSFAWTENINWLHINNFTSQLTVVESTGIALCFALAAFVKSAQLPFTPWLARAMEGPTPSSAIFYGTVMIHSGVFLLIQLRPIFEHSFLAMLLISFIGLATACYSFIVGLTQTDVKSSFVYATSGQLGLMFLECGLEFWQLAKWHLCAHAVVRAYQLLTAPSLMHNVHDNPTTPVGVSLASRPWLFVASLHRFWLDQITDWSLVKPIQRLAHDLSYFDDRVIDRFMGTPDPAINAVSSFVQLEEQVLGAKLDNEQDNFAHGTGLAGKLTQWTAAVMHWFEDKMVLRGVGKGTIRYGRELGHLANTFEQLVIRPRYLVLFVLITLLVAF